MAQHSFGELNEIQIDFLREIGNIGSARAATALSQMLGRPVDIAIPDVGMVGYDEAFDRLGGTETVMAGILLMITDDLSGMMMFLLPGAAACNLINQLMSTDIKEYSEIDEMGFSAIREMANIMSASFVNALSEMTGMVIDISPPSSTVDMLGSIMSVPAIHFAQMGDKLMYIKNDLEIASKTTPANILLLPDSESLAKLMKSLGIDI
jgi:chemotaxis protein CheC